MNPNASFWKVFRAILWKDLRVEIRSRENLAAMIVFALLVLFVFHFSIELQPDNQRVLAPGILWVTSMFSGNLGISRLMAAEKDRSSLDGLLLAPSDRSAIFCAKSTGVFLFIGITNFLLYPFFGLLFGVNLVLPGVILTSLLGIGGYALVGTAVATITLQTRTREVLLPVLLFPLTMPLLIAAVKATAGFLSFFPLHEMLPWLNILIVYDVIFFALIVMVYEYILEE